MGAVTSQNGRGECRGRGWSRALRLKQEAGCLSDSEHRSRETARCAMSRPCLKGFKTGVYLFTRAWGRQEDTAQPRRASSSLHGHRILVWERTALTQSPESLGGRPSPRCKTKRTGGQVRSPKAGPQEGGSLQPSQGSESRRSKN